MNASTKWHLDQRAAEWYESVLVPWILGPAARVFVDQAAFSLSDSDELAGLLEQGGFRNVRVEEIVFEVTLPPVREFVPEHIGATPMSIGYGGASRERQKHVLRSMESAMTGFTGKEGVRVPFLTHVALGQRDFYWARPSQAAHLERSS